jgi:hypothetical protein
MLDRFGEDGCASGPFAQRLCFQEYEGAGVRLAIGQAARSIDRHWRLQTGTNGFFTLLFVPNLIGPSQASLRICGQRGRRGLFACGTNHHDHSFWANRMTVDCRVNWTRQRQAARRREAKKYLQHVLRSVPNPGHQTVAIVY